MVCFSKGGTVGLSPGLEVWCPTFRRRVLTDAGVVVVVVVAAVAVAVAAVAGVVVRLLSCNRFDPHSCTSSSPTDTPPPVGGGGPSFGRHHEHRVHCCVGTAWTLRRPRVRLPCLDYWLPRVAAPRWYESCDLASRDCGEATLDVVFRSKDPQRPCIHKVRTYPRN